jgi:hypothetical protein
VAPNSTIFFLTFLVARDLFINYTSCLFEINEEQDDDDNNNNNNNNKHIGKLDRFKHLGCKLTVKWRDLINFLAVLR